MKQEIKMIDNKEVDSLEEIPTICKCGKKARFNVRTLNGEYLKEGDDIFQIRRHRGIRLSRRWMHRFSRWHTNLLEIIREL